MGLVLFEKERFMFSEGIGGINDDVVNAEPTDLDSIKKLVEEIKRRAKAQIGLKEYRECTKLYSKAIQVLPEEKAHYSDLAILYANRSMCNLQLGYLEKASEDGLKAIELDPSYVKGYYRRAVALIALKDKVAAKETLLSGLKLKPGDKELETQLSKLSDVKVKSESKVKESEAKEEAKVAASSVSESKVKSSTAMEIEEEEEKESGVNMRGYKKTSDGRTTSFFHTELDEEAKQLIGDIAPKKIDKPIDAGDVAAGTSVWNAAGTFEERVQTAWATDRLTALFEDVSVEVAGKNAVILIKKVESISGDAQIVSSRGKRKHVCDFTVTLKWILNVDDDLVTHGKVTVADITTDKDFEFTDIEVSKTQDLATSQTVLTEAEVQNLITTYIKSSPSRNQKGLQAALSRAIDEFCYNFQEK